eukprot:g3554.t1
MGLFSNRRAILCYVVFTLFVITVTNGKSLINKNNDKEKNLIVKAEGKVKRAEAKLNSAKEGVKVATEELKQAVDHLNKVSASISLKKDFKYQESSALADEKAKKITDEMDITLANEREALRSMGGNSAAQRNIQKLKDIDDVKYLRADRGTQMSWIEHSGDGNDLSRGYKILKKQMLHNE